MDVAVRAVTLNVSGVSPVLNTGTRSSVNPVPRMTIFPSRDTLLSQSASSSWPGAVTFVKVGAGTGLRSSSTHCHAKASSVSFISFSAEMPMARALSLVRTRFVASTDPLRRGSYFTQPSTLTALPARTRARSASMAPLTMPLASSYLAPSM